MNRVYLCRQAGRDERSGPAGVPLQESIGNCYDSGVPF